MVKYRLPLYHKSANEVCQSTLLYSLMLVAPLTISPPDHHWSAWLAQKKERKKNIARPLPFTHKTEIQRTINSSFRTLACVLPVFFCSPLVLPSPRLFLALLQAAHCNFSVRLAGFIPPSLGANFSFRLVPPGTRQAHDHQRALCIDFRQPVESVRVLAANERAWRS
jgi:hypothetical protein